MVKGLTKILKHFVTITQRFDDSETIWNGLKSILGVYDYKTICNDFKKSLQVWNDS